MIINVVVDEVLDAELVKWVNYQGRHYPGIRNRSAFIRMVLYDRMEGNEEKVIKKVENSGEIEENLINCIENFG